MKITRLEQDGQVVFQALFTEDEVKHIIVAAAAGILGEGIFGVVKPLAEFTVNALSVPCSELSDSELKAHVTSIRNHHHTGRFIADVTTLIKENTKP